MSRAPAKVKAATPAELEAVLGKALVARWVSLLAALEDRYPELAQTWKPAKTGAGGRMCLLQHCERTLVYLIPREGELCASLVVGERAVALAMKAPLPEAIKTMVAEAKPYAEGRGLRLDVRTEKDVATVAALVALKTTPA